MYTRSLESFSDPLSVDNKPFYTFYRTLKRWTTGTLWMGCIRFMPRFRFMSGSGSRRFRFTPVHAHPVHAGSGSRRFRFSTPVPVSVPVPVPVHGLPVTCTAFAPHPSACDFQLAQQPSLPPWSASASASWPCTCYDAHSKISIFFDFWYGFNCFD